MKNKNIKKKPIIILALLAILALSIVLVALTVNMVLTQKGDIRSWAKMTIYSLRTKAHCNRVGRSCTDGDCCAPNLCVGGVCVAPGCGGIGQACTRDTPCCDPTSPCVSGVCVALACGWEGMACTTDRPCCANYDCISKDGRSFPVCVKRCSLAGEFCNIVPCCDGSTCDAQGVCQSPGCVGNLQVCDNTFPCCDPTYTCIRGVCQRGQ